MTFIKNWIELAKAGGICGILLLIRPLIYLIFSRGRSLNEHASVDFSAFIFIVYAFICFIIAFKTLKKEKSSFSKLLMTSTPLLWFIIYTIYGTISMIWSVNFALTGFRAFECMAMILLIVAIMQRLFTTCSLDKIIDWTILFVVIDIIFSLIRYAQWTTNIFILLTASQMCSTVFFFMALYYSKKRWHHYLIIIMSILSGSTVAYIGMAAGSISILWRKTKYKPIIILGTIIITFVIYVIGPYKVLMETIFYDKETISIKETSGRDIMMELSYKTVEKNPYGYGFFAGEPYIIYSNGLRGITAHNSLFSAGIGLGYPGIIIISIFLTGMFFAVFSRKIPPHYKASLIGCFFVGFLQCMGNPGVGSRVYGAWLPVTYLFILICSFYVYGKYKSN